MKNKTGILLLLAEITAIIVLHSTRTPRPELSGQAAANQFQAKKDQLNSENSVNGTTPVFYSSVK